MHEGPFLLIRLPAVESIRPATTSIMPPLGLAYIAGALSANRCDVHVIDAVASAPSQVTRYFKGFLVGLTLDEICARIPKRTRYIGISCIFTHEWPMTVRLIEQIRTLAPQACIMVGGEHVTSMPEFCMMTSDADFLVTGEGERTVVQLWKALQTGEPFDSIAGIAFKKSGKIIVNPRRAREKNLDSIARPRWESFDLAEYHRHGFSSGVKTGGITVPILATRGCPYQCSYCSSPNMWTTTWASRTPSDVVDEIESLQKQFGARDFPLQDLTAIVKRDWIVEFCKEILSRNLQIHWQFPTGTRCEVIDEEVAALMRASGMVSISFAPESGSEFTRSMIKKRMKTDALERSIRAAVKNDLKITLFLVIGFPFETADLVEENLAFAKRMARLGVQDLSVGYYMALPGTEFFRELSAEPTFTLDRAYFQHIMQGLELFPSVSFSPSLSRFALFRFKVRIFASFYLERLCHLHQSIRESALGRTHSSKLATALTNAVRNSVGFLRALVKSRWIPLREEIRLFQQWDGIFKGLQSYHRLPKSYLEKPPAERNINALLRYEHGRALEIDATP